jgi:hypothetical protein
VISAVPYTELSKAIISVLSILSNNKTVFDVI